MSTTVIWAADPDVVKPALELIPEEIEVRVNRTGRFLTEQELIEGIRDVDGVVAGVEPYTLRVLEAAERLKIIARRGIGYSEIDLQAAAERGIFVTTTPVPEEITAVAELTVGLILSLLRKIPAADQDVKNGAWRRSQFIGANLHGRQVGIIGLGRIGRAVATQLSGFGVKLSYHDPYVDPSAVAPGLERLELEPLLANADIVTLHCNLTEEAQGLLNYDRLKLMKRGAYLINTARSKLVNELDLLRALTEGLLAGAALDVYSEIPPSSEALRQLVTHQSVISLPYIGAFTQESLYAMDATAVTNVLKVLRGENPDYMVKL